MSADWVKASLPPMLGPLPAWTIIPVPFLLLRWGVFTITITIAVFILGIYLTKKGRTLMWTVRRLRTYLRGYRMDARPLGYRRAMSVDIPLENFDLDFWREK